MKLFDLSLGPNVERKRNKIGHLRVLRASAEAAEKEAQFLAGVQDKIPVKSIVSDDLFTISDINLFREAKDEYFPEDRHRPTLQEPYQSPSYLNLHAAVRQGERRWSGQAPQRTAATRLWQDTKRGRKAGHRGYRVLIRLDFSRGKLIMCGALHVAIRRGVGTYMFETKLSEVFHTCFSTQCMIGSSPPQNLFCIITDCFV